MLHLMVGNATVACDTNADAAPAFSGVWNTNWGYIHVGTNGTNKIASSYSYEHSDGTVSGRFWGPTEVIIWPHNDGYKGQCTNVFYGTWSEDRFGEKHGGKLAFWIFESNPKQLFGKWEDEETGETGQWNGSK